MDLLVIGFTASDEVSTDVPTYLQKMNRMFERAYDMARMKFKSLHSDIGIIMRAKRMGNHSKLVTKYGYLIQAHSRKGISRKLSRSWEGPYTVVKGLSGAVYRIQKDGKDRKRVVVHFNQLKRCFANSREPSQMKARPKEQRIPLLNIPLEFTVQARDHDSTDEEEEFVDNSRRLPEREIHELLRREERVPTTSITEEPCTNDVFQREDMR